VSRSRAPVFLASQSVVGNDIFLVIFMEDLARKPIIINYEDNQFISLVTEKKFEKERFDVRSFKTLKSFKEQKEDFFKEITGRRVLAVLDGQVACTWQETFEQVLKPLLELEGVSPQDIIIHSTVVAFQEAAKNLSCVIATDKGRPEGSLKSDIDNMIENSKANPKVGIVKADVKQVAMASS
jgi:hypothetical protein